eukprot:1395488-Amorphochlora_amoeboformis.AAC.1
MRTGIRTMGIRTMGSRTMGIQTMGIRAVRLWALAVGGGLCRAPSRYFRSAGGKVFCRTNPRGCMRLDLFVL